MTKFILRFLEPVQAGNTDPADIVKIDDEEWRHTMRSEPFEVPDDQQGQFVSKVTRFADDLAKMLRGE